MKNRLTIISIIFVLLAIFLNVNSQTLNKQKINIKLLGSTDNIISFVNEG